MTDAQGKSMYEPLIGQAAAADHIVATARSARDPH